MRRTKNSGSAAVLTIVLVTVVSLALVPCAAAQAHRVEITPTIGYRWGGHLGPYDTALLDFDADLGSGTSFGLMFDVPISRHFEIELLADHQETELRRGRLFAPDRLGIDMDVTYYHIGLLWQWYPRYAQPYVVVSLGVTDFDPEMRGVSGDARFSASLGGGVKVPVSDTVAVRLEFRAFGTDLDDWGCGWSCGDHWWEYCGDHGCAWRDNGLSQGSIRLGVTFSL
jgi:opacity protein-like surface antigen